MWCHPAPHRRDTGQNQDEETMYQSWSLFCVVANYVCMYVARSSVWAVSDGDKRKDLGPDFHMYHAKAFSRSKSAISIPFILPVIGISGLFMKPVQSFHPPLQSLLY